METEFVTIQELALRYRVSTYSVARWWRDGRFPTPVRVGGRLMRWRMQDVVAWEQTNQEKVQVNHCTEGVAK